MGRVFDVRTEDYRESRDEKKAMFGANIDRNPVGHVASLWLVFMTTLVCRCGLDLTERMRCNKMDGWPKGDTGEKMGAGILGIIVRRIITSYYAWSTLVYPSFLSPTGPTRLFFFPLSA